MDSKKLFVLRERGAQAGAAARRNGCNTWQRVQQVAKVDQLHSASAHNKSKYLQHLHGISAHKKSTLHVAHGMGTRC